MKQVETSTVKVNTATTTTETNVALFRNTGWVEDNSDDGNAVDVYVEHGIFCKSLQELDNVIFTPSIVWGKWGMFCMQEVSWRVTPLVLLLKMWACTER